LFVQTQIGICFAVYFCENCATTATTKGKITETQKPAKSSRSTQKNDR